MNNACSNPWILKSILSTHVRLMFFICSAYVLLLIKDPYWLIFPKINFKLLSIWLNQSLYWLHFTFSVNLNCSFKKIYYIFSKCQPILGTIVDPGDIAANKTEKNTLPWEHLCFCGADRYKQNNIKYTRWFKVLKRTKK